MTESYKLISINKQDRDSELLSKFNYVQAEKTKSFHEKFMQYHPTPLVELKELAAEIGINSLYVKDESKRFDLNAFKVLGSSYAVGKYVAQLLGKSMDEIDFSHLKQEIREIKPDGLTFITATDGNHGRGVAWSANELGCRSVVYMPKGTARERLDNIRKLNSDASITDLVYDDAVRLARRDAETNNWVLVQDTSFDGYEKVPTDIMQGYLTMGYEISRQLEDIKPTHVFLQAGVGSMAGSIAAYFYNLYSDNPPIIVVVEPDSAACILSTAEANDGKLHFANKMNSEMAGLCCGEPCSVAWSILSEVADYCISVPDNTTETGMKALAHPIGNDIAVVSGESGAVTTGLVIEIMTDNRLENVRQELKLDSNSTVLCISTEGDTDKENYHRIVK